MAIVATGLERQVERATQQGVRVVAEGRRNVDGRRVFLVESARNKNLWHPVALIAEDTRLVCDCRAAQFNKSCIHQGAVALYLRAKVRADMDRLERRDRVVRSVDRATGEVMYAASSWERETAPLRRDNQPISIWK